MNVIAIQSEAFEALIAEHELVFLDFWAPWCAPCVSFSKVYHETAQCYPNVVFAQINIEESPELADSLEIRSIPYLMVIKQGVVIYAESGSMPKSRLDELIEQALVVEVKTK
jgi:thioredoxin 1